MRQVMRFWKKPHTIWRYSEPTIYRGHVTIPYTELTLPIDVQTLEDVTITTEDGTRSVQKLKAFCDEQILVEDSNKKQKGDRLIFQGKLFECTSCRLSENTPLSHYLATFTECLDQSELYDSDDEGEEEPE